MNPELAALAAANGGVFTTANVRRAGYAPQDITRQVARGEWHRLRRGSFVTGDQWASSDAVQRHLLLSRAVVVPYGGRAALTHTSGACGLGLSLWKPVLDIVHLTHCSPDKGRIEHGVAHHKGPLDNTATVLREGLRIGPPELVVAGAMLLAADQDSAVVVGDSALRNQVTTREALWAVATEWLRVPDSRALRFAIPRLDAGAANGGESLGRQVVRRLGFPRPQTQYEIRDADFVAYADMAWPEQGVLLEFDGKRKYQRDLQEGDDPGEVVFREKLREDRLRRLGWIVVRLVWADLQRPAIIAHRLNQAFQDAALLRRVA